LSGRSLTFKLNGVPVFNNGHSWQASGSFDYVTPITKKLGVVLSAVDNYFEIAPRTFNKNYVKISLGLQYTPSSPTAKQQ
jgi:hypothetical protein